MSQMKNFLEQKAVQLVKDFQRHLKREKIEHSVTLDEARHCIMNRREIPGTVWEDEKNWLQTWLDQVL